MVQVEKIETHLVDDLDGTRDGTVGTVSFAVDGKSFEMELSGKNAEELRGVLAPFVGVARRTGAKRGGLRSVSRPTRTDRKDLSAIRKWARDNGHDVGDRGRIPAEVLDAYKAAAGVKPQRAAAEPVAAEPVAVADPFTAPQTPREAPTKREDQADAAPQARTRVTGLTGAQTVALAAWVAGVDKVGASYAVFTGEPAVAAEAVNAGRQKLLSDPKASTADRRGVSLALSRVAAKLTKGDPKFVHVVDAA